MTYLPAQPLRSSKHYHADAVAATVVVVGAVGLTGVLFFHGRISRRSRSPTLW